jgi:hypothetical protein
MILCLDLATSTGAAWGEPGERAASAVWNLRDAGKDRPARFLQLARLLSSAIVTHKITAIYYEAPLPLSAMMRVGAHEETIAFLRGLCAITEFCAADTGLPVETWDVQEARRAVLGQARGLDKRAIIRTVQYLGYPAIENDNEADALVGFLYWSARLKPAYAYRNTPLFAKTCA